MDLNDAKTAFMAHLEALGKHPRTRYTYAKDLDYLIEYFGGDRAIESIRLPEVGKFLKSPIFLESKTGKARCARTTDKNLRVIRKFFLWAKGQGLLETLPLPKAIPMGEDEKAPVHEDIDMQSSV